MDPRGFFIACTSRGGRARRRTGCGTWRFGWRAWMRRWRSWRRRGSSVNHVLTSSASIRFPEASGKLAKDRDTKPSPASQQAAHPFASPKRRESSVAPLLLLFRERPASLGSFASDGSMLADEVSAVGTQIFRALYCGRLTTSSVSRLAGDAVCHLPLKGKAWAEGLRTGQVTGTSRYPRTRRGSSC